MCLRTCWECVSTEIKWVSGDTIREILIRCNCNWSVGLLVDQLIPVVVWSAGRCEPLVVSCIGAQDGVNHLLCHVLERRTA